MTKLKNSIEEFNSRQTNWKEGSMYSKAVQSNSSLKRSKKKKE